MVNRPQTRMGIGLGTLFVCIKVRADLAAEPPARHPRKRGPSCPATRRPGVM